MAFAIRGGAAFLRGPAVTRPARAVQNAMHTPRRYSMASTQVEAPAAAAIFDKFEVTHKQYVEEYGADATMYIHKKTGAEILSISNDDENKVFGVTFKTPNADSTGVAHILEHSVLCGSRKYPLKEPFVELLKGSLQTFLNAMTYPDRTVYPVASCNLQDFHNLVDVYLDSVFYPNITPNTFKQEGWHYELEAPEDPLIYKGVVFNEMKGVYSSPDQLNARYGMRAIFPDTIYWNDSGGDPEDIPDLTFEQFKNFHTKYYHPSNARIFFAGDDSVESRLTILEDYLGAFDPAPITSDVVYQQRKSSPWQVAANYPTDPEAADPKQFVSVNWLVNEQPMEPQTHLAFGVLNHLLLSNSASVLEKALSESGLGESVTGGGFGDYLQQATWQVGLKGVANTEEGTQAVEKLILDTLQEVVDKGFDKEAVAASMNAVEFQMREFNTGSFPRGLSFMLGALNGWLYGKNPVSELRFEAPLAALKADLADGKRVFEDLIQEYLLANTHRVTVSMKPSATLAATIAEREKERLATKQATLSEADIMALIEETKQLKEAQETPDSLEALQTIPSVGLGDLSSDIRHVPLDVEEVPDAQGAQILRHDLQTAGIVYAQVGFNLKRVSQEDLPLLGLFSRCLKEMGTFDQDDVAISRRIDTHTGGVGLGAMFEPIDGGKDLAAYLMLRGKATASNVPEMLDIMRNLVLDVNLDKPKKFLEMVTETRAGMESGLISSGNSFAAARVGARYNLPGYLSESMGGVTYLHTLRGLEAQVKQDWPAVLTRLQRMRTALVARDNMVVDLTADDKSLQSIDGAVSGFLAAMPTGGSPLLTWSMPEGLAAPDEGFAVPTQVNYVAKGCPIYQPDEKVPGSTAVVSRFLRTSWLWDKVRVVGGAYGAGISFNRFTGMACYTSYRDPNVLQTLDAYDGTPGFLANLDLSPDELVKSIVGAVGEMDQPMTPDQKGHVSMLRHLTGITDEERQQWRSEVLSTTQRDFQDFGERLQAAREGSVAVVGGEEVLKAAQSKLPDLKVDKLL